MSLGDVKKDVRAILNRRDAKDDIVSTFISQGMARVQRNLRIPSMERAQVLTAVYGPLQSFPLNEDLLQFIDLFANGRPVEHKSFRQLMAMTPPQVDIGSPPPGCVGVPEFYGRVGSSIFLWPYLAQGSQLVLTYYGAFDPLVSDDGENALTKSAPDLLTYAALTFAADYFQMDQKAAWEANFSDLLLNVQDEANQLDALGGASVIAPAHADY